MTSRILRDRIKQRLGEAEGYLTLKLPERALQVIARRADWATMQFEASFLTGEALRCLERYQEALKPLEAAAALHPHDVDVAIALGWCYRRTHRLAQAIDTLKRASTHHRDEPRLHYNLACYWSFAGNAPKALDELAEALEHDPALRSLVADEPDFDPLRGLPEFARLLVVAGPVD